MVSSWTQVYVFIGNERFICRKESTWTGESMAEIYRCFNLEVSVCLCRAWVAANHTDCDARSVSFFLPSLTFFFFLFLSFSFFFFLLLSSSFFFFFSFFVRDGIISVADYNSSRVGVVVVVVVVVFVVRFDATSKLFSISTINGAAAVKNCAKPTQSEKYQKQFERCPRKRW